MWRLLYHPTILVAPLLPKGSGRVNAPASQGQLRQDVHLYQLLGICDHYLELLRIPCDVCIS